VKKFIGAIALIAFLLIIPAPIIAVKIIAIIGILISLTLILGGNKNGR
jgi:hypothetical protein